MSELFITVLVFSDYLDIVKDPISSGDYRKEEDPVLFVSSKTNRGPLDDNWREEYTVANKVCIFCLFFMSICYSFNHHSPISRDQPSKVLRAKVSFFIHIWIIPSFAFFKT